MSGIIGTSHSKSKVIGRSKDTCKAWINFSTSGSVTVRDSFNCTASWTSAGVYTITFYKPMSNTTYSVQADCGNYESGTSNMSRFHGHSLTTTQFGLQNYDMANTSGSNTLADRDGNFVVVHGD